MGLKGYGTGWYRDFCTLGFCFCFLIWSISYSSICCFSLHTFVIFPDFLQSLNSSFISSCLWSTHGMISIFLSLGLVLWPNMIYFGQHSLCFRRMPILLLLDGKYVCWQDMGGLVYLLIFGQNVPCIFESGILDYFDSKSVSFISANVCFIHMWVLWSLVYIHLQLPYVPEDRFLYNFIRFFVFFT